MLEPTSYVHLAIGNKEQKTAPKPKTTSPKWEESFQFLIHNPSVQELIVNVSSRQVRGLAKLQKIQTRSLCKWVGVLSLSQNFFLENRPKIVLC